MQHYHRAVTYTDSTKEPTIGDVALAQTIGKQPINRKYLRTNCEQCGEPKWSELKFNVPVTHICIKCVDPHNKGRIRSSGKVRKATGYIVVKLNVDELFFQPMANKKRDVLEHRLVMAKYLRRCLLSWEIVHHKNGVKDDNRIENLELLPSSKSHLIDMVSKSIIASQTKRIKSLEAKLLDSSDSYDNYLGTNDHIYSEAEEQTILKEMLEDLTSGIKL